MQVSRFLLLAAALAFGMMALSVFTTVLAYLIGFALVGLLVCGGLYLAAKNPGRSRG